MTCTAVAPARRLTEPQHELVLLTVNALAVADVDCR